MSLDNQTNPFVGLRPFESDESLLFFGRQEQTMELLQRLHEHHFVAIIGNSGCGKSSLIRGGLIPRLKAGYLVDDRDRWMIAIMKPGQSPLHNLAAVILNQLNKGGDDAAVISFVEQIREQGADAILERLKLIWEEQNTNFFLLVDQFEELFRFSMDQKEVDKKDEAIDFVNIMLELSRQTNLPIYVVMTMRSDFIGDCAQFFGLPEAMNLSQYLVPRLNRVQLKNVIEGPVKLYGSSIHPSLTSRLLNDSGIIKDELPLLQHALMRIWDHKMTVDKNGELDLRDYESIGGIEKALSYHADEALQGLSENELALTKQIFQSLIVTDEGGRKVRRPVLMSELSLITRKDREQLLAIINRFSEEKRSFLIISKTAHSNDELIDISHESLIRQWDKLSAWADEESESSKIYLQLDESARLFKNKKKDLLKGREFQIAMQWYETFKPSGVWAKRYNDGYDESIDYLLRSSKEVKLAERRKRNRLVLTFSALIIGLCAVFIIIKTRTDKQKEAAVELKDAFALNSTANNLEIDNPTIAIRLAEAGFAKEPEPSFTETMKNIYSKNAFYKTIVTESFEIPFLSMSPDGKSFVTASYGGNAKLWDLDGNMIQEFKQGTDSIVSVTFSPDGKKVLTASRHQPAKLWDLKGQILQEYTADDGGSFIATISPDGTKVVTGAADGGARVYDIGGTLLKTFPKHKRRIKSLAFSPDGLKILTGSEDRTVKLWDLNGNLIQVFNGHKDCIAGLAFSPDGTKIATGSFDETIILWDLKGNRLKQFIGHNWPIYSVSFSKDGKKILSASTDNTAKLWDLDGNVIQEFKGHTDRVTTAAFISDDTRIITSSSDKTVRLWYRVNNLFREFRDYNDSVNTIIFSPDGKKVFIGSSDKTAKLYNLNGSLIREFQRHAERITAAAFSSDGSRIVMAYGNILESRTPGDSLLGVYKGHTDRIMSIALSGDGSKILTGSADSTARLWNMNGQLISKFKLKDKVIAVALSKDGTKIFTASHDYIVGQWATDGSLTRSIKLKENKRAADSVCMAFSPDATKIVVSNKDSTARLWSLDNDGRLLTTFKGHRRSVLAVTFSPDGTRVLTGAEDYKARLFDLDGKLLMELKGHNECVIAVTFSFDGTKILTGSEDYTARLWNNMPLNDFLNSNLVDKLTADEKKQYNVVK